MIGQRCPNGHRNSTKEILFFSYMEMSSHEACESSEWWGLRNWQERRKSGIIPDFTTYMWNWLIRGCNTTHQQKKVNESCSSYYACLKFCAFYIICTQKMRPWWYSWTKTSYCNVIKWWCPHFMENLERRLDQTCWHDCTSSCMCQKLKEEGDSGLSRVELSGIKFHASESTRWRDCAKHLCTAHSFSIVNL